MTDASPAPAAAPKKRAQAWWKRHLAVPVGRVFANVLSATWRITEHNAEPYNRLRAENKPFLLACWHGQLFMGVMLQRHRGFAALASTHGDADLIARMMMSWGYTFVRGSSSQGGREALVRMVQHLRDGLRFAITPDGPRGPRGVAKPGALVAAVRSGVPVVPLRFEVSSAWRFHSWDRFCLPKPFATVRAIYGDPWIPPDSSEASLAEFAHRLGPAEAVDLSRAPIASTTARGAA